MYKPQLLFSINVFPMMEYIQMYFRKHKAIKSKSIFLKYYSDKHAFLDGIYFFSFVNNKKRIVYTKSNIFF